jgi:ribosomal protein S6--L-glutamate ligase
MDILIVSNNLNSLELKLVVNEIKYRKMSLKVIRTDEISLTNTYSYNPKIVYLPHNIFNKSTYYEFLHRFLILEKLEKKATIINPLMSMIRYNKAYFSEKTIEMQLLHPLTLVTENIAEAYDFIVKLFNKDLRAILKPLSRSQGTGVYMLKGEEHEEQLMQILFKYSQRYCQGVFYVQQHIPNKGYDVRLFVIDGNIVARMKRSNPSDFRYNASRGALTEVYLENCFDNLALAAAEGMNLKICGVDILPDLYNKPYLLETNCYPGFAHINKLSKEKIHIKIIDYFEKILKNDCI